MGSAAAAPALALESLDDSTLARRATKRSDRAAFDELYRRHHNQLLNTIRHYINSPDDAQDILSETFLKAWRFRKSFRGDSKFSTWLTRIAINECRMFHRKGKYVREHGFTFHSIDAPVPNTEGDDYIYGDVAVDDLVIKGRADRERINKIMSGMPAIYKQVFRMYFYDQRTIAEIQKEFNLTEPTVKSRILRGRRHFFRALSALDMTEMT